MAFGNTIRSAAIALAAGAATAVLVYWGNGLMPRWPLMWLAPVPVVVFALRRPAWQAAVVAAAAWLAGGLNLWGYFHAFQVPWFAVMGSGAVVFAAGVVLMRALERRGRPWSAWVALPAVWVAFEFARNLWLWPHGSAGSIAYSQLEFLPFLQLAAITGPWGMGFVLMLFPAGLALGLHRWRWDQPRAVRTLGATAGVLAAVLIFGAVRLAHPQPGPEVTVGLIASDANGNMATKAPGAPTQRLFEDYVRHAQPLLAQGAQVIVMPEHRGVALDTTVAQVDAIFQPIADQTGATLVAGMARLGVAGRYNQARIYAPQQAVRTYNKEHLLPPFETSQFSSGHARTLWSVAGAASGPRWGVAICKDMDFTDPARSYGRAGVGLMLVPAWDAGVDRVWHGHIAVMRAVEDGFSLVRSVGNGNLTVADNRGRILAERRSDSAPFATLLVRVPSGHSNTVFLLLGDWFGWIAVALALWVLARLGAAGRSVAPRAQSVAGADARTMQELMDHRSRT